MNYVIICPACNAEVRSREKGDVCECGYSHINAAGQVYTRRHAGEPWMPEPNILVVEEPVVPWAELPAEEPIEEPPIRAHKAKEEE